MNASLSGSSDHPSYQLVDFGRGRKLEDLGGYRVDRPSPAAIGMTQKLPGVWQEADAFYDTERQSWTFRNPWPNALQLDCGGFWMPVQPTPYGHIGLFPEQASNWSWIRKRVTAWLGTDFERSSSMGTSTSAAKTVSNTKRQGACAMSTLQSSLQQDDQAFWGLNLFGYTGASSLAMVSAGLSVAHVDAAKPNVQSCKLAAECNGWGDAPVRYLVDDALKFSQREVRRGRRYQMVVLDPPAYGHSPAGKAWRLERDLWPLLDACVENIHFVDVENRVGYFRLTNFQKTTTRDVENALWKLHREGMRSLIIDVRGNPGGLLSAAVEVADRFLSDGRIVTTRGRNTRENADYNAHRTNTWNLPIAVLIDRDSASASEIFAGAIADQKRGAIIGETSFGKGSVQGIFRMQAAKFGLCLTTAKFYSPSGKAISQNGVAPDLEVSPTYIAARPNPLGQITRDIEDATLQHAIAELAGEKRISRDQATAYAK
ncbi:S41 family peptidase [Rhodopirellula sp.]|nr:S41 family peptidase [Rhodopirellula sp.]